MIPMVPPLRSAILLGPSFFTRNLVFAPAWVSRLRVPMIFSSRPEAAAAITALPAEDAMSSCPPSNALKAASEARICVHSTL